MITAENDWRMRLDALGNGCKVMGRFHEIGKEPGDADHIRIEFPDHLFDLRIGLPDEQRRCSQLSLWVPTFQGRIVDANLVPLAEHDSRRDHEPQGRRIRFNPSLTPFRLGVSSRTLFLAID